MCLAIPGKIIELFETNGLPMALIDFAGARNQACMAYTPEAQIGQFVLVHAGFALQTLNEQEAADSLAELTRLSALMEADEPEAGP